MRRRGGPSVPYAERTRRDKATPSERHRHVAHNDRDDPERTYATTFDVLLMDIECGEVDFCRENPEMLAALKLAIIEIHDMRLSRDAAADVRARLAAAGLRHTMGGGLTEVWERQADSGEA